MRTTLFGLAALVLGIECIGWTGFGVVMFTDAVWTPSSFSPGLLMGMLFAGNGVLLGVGAYACFLDIRRNGPLSSAAPPARSDTTAA